MNIIVAVVVYNRFENLKRWVHCWKQCDQTNADLVIIHTGDEIEKFKQVCEGVTYIHRKNIGFDIGCFQDVCLERLKGFPAFDYLLWCTDDTIPMQKDFIRPFIEALKPDVGISCMQISISKPGGIKHVRTTGFCIRNETAKKLIFNVDPITTKSDCYHFEHKGKDMTMTEQIRGMGLSCQQVESNKNSPLWDNGYWKRLDRQAEHDFVFYPDKKKSDKVTFICTIYNTYPQIISSLLLQTHHNWELILIHDGPSSNGMRGYIGNDPRIKYIETEQRKGNFGHHLRQWALNEMSLGDYTVITNADNYYVPVFVEYMLKGFQKSHTSVATYCDKMTHSYKEWDVLDCKLERGFLDCGGVMVRSEIAKDIGWKNIVDHSADWIYLSDIAARYSWKNFVQVKGNLFVHN